MQSRVKCRCLTVKKLLLLGGFDFLFMAVLIIHLYFFCLAIDERVFFLVLFAIVFHLLAGDVIFDLFYLQSYDLAEFACCLRYTIK